MYSDNTDLKSPVYDEKLDNFVEQLISKYDQKVCDKIQTKTRGHEKNLTGPVLGKEELPVLISDLYTIRSRTQHHIIHIKIVIGYCEFKTSVIGWGKSHEPASHRMYIRGMESTHNNV